MSEQLFKKWVAGVVNQEPRLGPNFPYTFFEIDTKEQKVHDYVLSVYKKYNLDVIEHVIGKGTHFFGSTTDRQIWREWYSELKSINEKYPPLTLRITKKFSNELFERPIYHEAQSKPLDWSRSLMHFLNKEIKGKNRSDLHFSMNDCGLPKYFKTVVYPVEVKV